MPVISKEVYLNSVLEQIPRLLGLTDRNISSNTYGCFDRSYWHYKIIDFPCARYQEAVLTLAILYKYGPNPYRANKNILAWINASLDFWCKIQQKNGSFNEWYPWENSFVASAFSAYAISETLLILGIDVIQNHNKILSHLQKVGVWLCNKQELGVANQTFGAIISLYNIFLLTHISKYKNIAERKVRLMNKRQNNEGWFNEYGGADLGYLSLLIDYLSKYYYKSKDRLALLMLEKAINFIAEFIHPDFSFGGNLGSRNTEYLIPSGFEMLSSEFEKAAFCAINIRKATLENSAVSLSSLDDRYLCYIGYNWLQAYFYSEEIKDIDFKRILEKKKVVYPDAGICIVKNKDFFLIVNFKKGGSFNLFVFPDKRIFDSGVIIEDYAGNSFYSGYMGSSRDIQELENELVIGGNFAFIRQSKQTLFKFLLLRLFLLLLGKFENIGFFIKQRLRRGLILKAFSSDIAFTRIIQFGAGRVSITDKIKLQGKHKIKRIILGAKSSFIYVPSSRYFRKDELDNIPVYIQGAEISKHIKDDSFVFERSFKKSEKESV